MRTVTKPIDYVKIMKKISIIHKDGFRRQNLKPETAAELIDGLEILWDIKILVDDKNLRKVQVKELFDLLPHYNRLEDSPTEKGFIFMAIPASTVKEVEKETPEEKADLNAEVKEQVKATKAAGRKPGLPYIILDKDMVYTNATFALEGVGKLMQDRKLPGRYKNSVTATFMRGSISGQIRSLFKDLKRFGLAIQPKIRDFFKCSATDSKYDTYSHNLMTLDLEPTASKTLTANGKVDMDYFKFFVLYQLSGLKK